MFIIFVSIGIAIVRTPIDIDRGIRSVAINSFGGYIYELDR